MGEDDFQALWLNASEKEGYTSISEGRMILIIKPRRATFIIIIITRDMQGIVWGEPELTVDGVGRRVLYKQRDP